MAKRLPTHDAVARPDIDIADKQDREICDQAMRAITRLQEESPRLFYRANRLVRFEVTNEGEPILKIVTEGILRRELNVAVNFMRGKSATGVPIGVIRQVFGLRESDTTIPGVTGIVNAPTLQPDGTINTTPGYHAQTHLYYHPRRGMERCRIPDAPTQDDVRAAIDKINLAIGDFPYMAEADYANTIAAMLTPLVQPAINGKVPLCLIDAPKQGTGKGLLADVIAYAASGAPMVTESAPTSEEEYDKRIVGWLMAGRSMVCLDNVGRKLASDSFDILLTTATYGGRLLGTNDNVRLANNTMFVATGNNIQLGKTLARRSYRIRLDRGIAKPWLLPGTMFHIENLDAWLKDHYVELTAALLTLARFWVVQGKPRATSLKTIGRFEQWVQTIGSILECAGIHGFLANLNELYTEADDEENIWESFVTYWYRKFGDRKLHTSDIVEVLKTDVERTNEDAVTFPIDCIPPILLPNGKDKEKGYPVRIGAALAKKNGACFGDDNLRFEAIIDGHSKQKLYRVIPVQIGSVSGFTPFSGKTDDAGTLKNGKNTNQPVEPVQDTMRVLAGTYKHPSQNENAYEPGACRVPASTRIMAGSGLTGGSSNGHENSEYPQVPAKQKSSFATNLDLIHAGVSVKRLPLDD